MPTAWFPDPGVVAVTASATFVYAHAERRARRGRPATRAQRSRRFAFLVGSVVALVALVPPLDILADRSLSVHMVQHLLLTMIAAPLLVAGAPVTVALRGWTDGPRRALKAFLRSVPVRVLANPMTTWALFVVVLWSTHFTGIYDLALRNDLVHAAEHTALLATAVLFWLPVVGIDPIPGRLSPPARILYLFLAMPAVAFLGLAISTAPHVLYPTYAQVEGARAALADQRLGGAIMWGGGMVLMVMALSMVLWDWMGADEREAARVDRRLSAAGGAASLHGAEAR